MLFGSFDHELRVSLKFDMIVNFLNFSMVWILRYCSFSFRETLSFQKGFSEDWSEFYIQNSENLTQYLKDTQRLEPLLTLSVSKEKVKIKIYLFLNDSKRFLDLKKFGKYSIFWYEKVFIKKYSNEPLINTFQINISLNFSPKKITKWKWKITVYKHIFFIGLCQNIFLYILFFE